MSLQDAAQDAVSDVVAIFPEVETRLEDLNADAPDREGVEAELAALVKGMPNEQTVVRLHKEATERRLLQAYERSLDEAGAYADKLGALGLELWPAGKAFYCGPGAFVNWIGVLVTIAFLTFGAPF